MKISVSWCALILLGGVSAHAQVIAPVSVGTADSYFDDSTAEPSVDSDPTTASYASGEYGSNLIGCDEVGCDEPGCDEPGCDDFCGSCGCGSCYLFGSDEAWTLFDNEDSPIQIGGWFQAGYHNRNTPLSANRGDLAAFNDVPGQVNLHQGWLYAEKVAEGGEGNLDFGFRLDLMYGTDAQKTQAFNNTGGWDTNWDNGVYGWAMPQAYVEVAGGDWSIKAGHFYTLVGYEVVTAPDNFFYSHALTMFNTEPFTHTGVLGTYSVNEGTEVYAGWTLGWDTGFEGPGNASSFLGGVSQSVTDDITVTYIATAGDFGPARGNGYSHSIVIDTALTDKLNYVIQSDYLNTNGSSIGGGNEDDIGINQYFIYSVNDCLGLGTRMEWWKDEGTSFYAATFGVNYRPQANVVLRPEIRHDWQPANRFDQTTFGVDAIVTF